MAFQVCLEGVAPLELEREIQAMVVINLLRLLALQSRKAKHVETSEQIESDRDEDL